MVAPDQFRICGDTTGPAVVLELGGLGADEAMSTLLRPITDEAEASRKPLEILILDDMETDRMRLKRLCRRAGLNFRAREATTVAEFREALAGPTVDVAFLDYALGMETGLDALRVLGSDPDQSQAVAIMVSSLDDLDIAIEALRLGASDYINKEELSVGAIRKAIALAFERRLLMSSLAEARVAEQDMRKLLARVARTCGTEVREVIAATLEQGQRVAAVTPGVETEALSTSLERLDRMCVALGRYLATIEVDDAEMAQGIDRRWPMRQDPL